MNTKDLIRLGVPVGEPIRLAHEFIQSFIAQGHDGALLEAEIFNIVANPPAFFADELRGPLARAVYRPAFTPRAELAPWRQWGEGLEAEAVKQMANACALPVAVAGALMPDAHLGYGLPIGGVLATDNAVIPYAVGVDIACRMKLTVYERKANTIAGERDRLANLIADETRFGMGCSFQHRREHDVMDEDWSVSPVTNRLRDKAWSQLGTSGSANHFVEFGAFTADAAQAQALGLEPGEYLALLTHSGSRGIGAQVEVADRCDCSDRMHRAYHRSDVGMTRWATQVSIVRKLTPSARASSFFLMSCGRVSVSSCRRTRVHACPSETRISPRRPSIRRGDREPLRCCLGCHQLAIVFDIIAGLLPISRATFAAS